MDAFLSLSPIEVNLPVRNIHRSVGTMLSGEIARRYGSAGLPDDTIRIHSRARPAKAWERFSPRESRSRSKAKPTTMWARDFPAAESSCIRRTLPALLPKKTS